MGTVGTHSFLMLLDLWKKEEMMEIEKYEPFKLLQAWSFVYFKTVFLCLNWSEFGTEISWNTICEAGLKVIMKSAFEN